MRLRPLSLRQLGIGCLVASIAVMGGTMIEEPPGDITIMLLGLAAALMVAAGMLVAAGWNERTAMIGALVAAVVMVVMPLLRFTDTITGIPEILVTQLVGVAAILATVFAGPSRKQIVAMLGITVIVVVAFFAVRFSTNDPIAIDVYLLHEAAAEALTDGHNPYTTGNVRVIESHRFAGAEWIEEYTYPPVTLVAYAGSSILFGDSRIAGAIAITVSFALVLWLMRALPADPDHTSVPCVAIVGLMAAVPMTYFIVYTAWTEAIALPLLMLSAGWWTKRRVLSAVMLGIAFASKQYFIVAAPMLFFLPGPYRWRRVGIVGAAAVATFMPFLLWDVHGFVNGVIRHHLTRAPRPDSSTLAGMGVHVPTAIGVGVAVLVGILIARRAHSSAHVLLGISAVISTFTLLSLRGFRNQWWLAAMLACVALGLGVIQTDAEEAAPG